MKQSDIDALARFLDGDLTDGEAPAEARALGAFAKALEGTARPTPEFTGKAALRASLIEAAREQAASPTLLARMRGSVNEATARWRYSMRVAAATGASAMALSTGGVALASQQSLPGDALYGVKLALEDVGLLFIGDQATRGEQQLINAGERVEEARASAETQDMAGAMRALRESDTAARAGARDIIEASQERGDPSLLDLLETFSTQQRERLATLLPLLTGDAKVAADDMMVSLNRIDQRVAVLSGSCADCAAREDTAGRGNRRTDAVAGGRGNGGSTRSGAGDGSADARTFDFADIPPASEPFTPCPCVPASEPTATGGKPPADAEEPVDEAEEEAPEKPRKPRQPKPTEPEQPPAGDDEEVRPTLPPELEEPVDEVEDEVDDVVDDVLDGLPTDPPALPDQDTSNRSRIPTAVPTLGAPLP